MVEKEHVLKLLKQNQSFVVFGKEFVFAFTWDEKRGMYEENIKSVDGKKVMISCRCFLKGVRLNRI